MGFEVTEAGENVRLRHHLLYVCRLIPFFIGAAVLMYKGEVVEDTSP